MIRPKVAASFAFGLAVGVLICADTLLKTCENVSEDGFTCSRCKSHTDYEPKVPFRFCPICSAYVMHCQDKAVES